LAETLVNNTKNGDLMSIQILRQGTPDAVALAAPVHKSSLVRQLLSSRSEPATRVLAWLLDSEDARLLGLGSHLEDIALLRGIARSGLARESIA
jgi:hypothetical protein